MSMDIVRAEASDVISLQNFIPCAAAIECLAETSARRLNVVPIALWEAHCPQQLLVACEDPSDATLKERLRKHIPKWVDPVFVRSVLPDISPAISKCYRVGDSFQQMISMCSTADETRRVLAQQPDFLIRLLEVLLLEASLQRASDIHVSPDKEALHFRLRIDGVLTTIGSTHLSLSSAFLVRIKVIAAMDIAETRQPQDGQFNQLIEGRNVDFRVSTFPTVQGENTVFRVLSEHSGVNTLDSMGLNESCRQQLAQLVQRPDGLIIICGPTGAGKSTTLYALLNELDRDVLNIMTLEDPVERQISGIRQTNIDSDRMLDYADGVRALLRQDPDVLLIGEIRDTHSCSHSLRAVTTGHLVLTTVHASSVFGAIARMRELGAGSAALASNLVAVVCQRLVRKCCQFCSLESTDCVHCHGLGYLGRQVVLELLVTFPELKGLIAANAPLAQVEASAVASGFSSLRDQAALLVDSGVTSEDEVVRVLGG